MKFNENRLLKFQIHLLMRRNGIETKRTEGRRKEREERRMNAKTKQRMNAVITTYAIIIIIILL